MGEGIDEFRRGHHAGVVNQAAVTRSGVDLDLFYAPDGRQMLLDPPCQFGPTFKTLYREAQAARRDMLREEFSQGRCTNLENG